MLCVPFPWRVTFILYLEVCTFCLEFVVVVQLLSHVQVCHPMDYSTPGLPILLYLPEFAQTHVHWVGDAIQLSHPLLPPSPPVLNLFSIRVFPNKSALHTRLSKYWSFSFCPSKEYSGFISFKTDWFDVLAVQGTLKNLLQHHSSKASKVHTQPTLWSNSHTHTWLHEKP